MLFQRKSKFKSTKFKKESRNGVLGKENFNFDTVIKNCFLNPNTLSIYIAKKIARLFIFVLLLQSCANIVPPSGGDRDETPPILLSIKPGDSSLQKRISKIELRFNKYMVIKDLEKNLQISPLLAFPPTVTAFGKRIEIKITDSLLEDNTTYRLSLGDALVDNREATPYKNFNYTFSTGTYFDSLKIHGRVFNAETGLPDSSITIMLYKSSETDSSILRKKPFYIQKTDRSGNFSFSNLPDRSFKVFAVEDINRNKLYDFGTEKVGFLDSIITPNSIDTNTLVFHVFKETSDTSITGNLIDTTAKSSTETRSSRFDKPEKKQDKNLDYKVLVDTSSLQTRTFDIAQNLIIELYKPVLIDTSKIYLSFDDDGIEVEAVQRLLVSDTKIEVQTKWLQNKAYTLRLVKGWAKDSLEVEFIPGKYFFRTKSKEDYGSLKINIDSIYINNDHVLVLLNNKDSIFQQTININNFTVPMLNQGNYTLRIFKDENKNGRWDAGNLFKKKHAEKVIPYLETIIIKNGWDNEIDFKEPKEIEIIEKEEGKKDRFKEK